MKKSIVRLALAAAVGLVPVSAQAEWTPKGPIKLMIAFKAGGGADTISRLIAEELEKRKGWKVIPEQVTGKGGVVLAAKLKGEPNDGTSIGMMVTESLTYNMLSAKGAGVSLSDFTPVTTVAGFQMGVVALTKSYKSWNDVVAAAKSGKAIRFGAMSPRLGDLAYMLGKAQGIDLNIVMLKGGKGVMNGLNAGDVDIGWGAGIQTKAVRAGDMVNLVSGLNEPLAISPKAPLIKSLGVPYSAGGYFLFAGPAGMPSDARAALAKAIAEVVQDPSTKAAKIIQRAFGGPSLISGEKLDQLLATENDDAKALIAAVPN
ncbi:MAG: tripartite tricarboxylate transporter substrate-binding protein [Pseudomonadota bacterium]